VPKRCLTFSPLEGGLLAGAAGVWVGAESMAWTTVRVHDAASMNLVGPPAADACMRCVGMPCIVSRGASQSGGSGRGYLEGYQGRTYTCSLQHVWFRSHTQCRDHKRCSRLVSHTTKESYVLHTTRSTQSCSCPCPAALRPTSCCGFLQEDCTLSEA
jgi:hypothetical protein